MNKTGNVDKTLILIYEVEQIDLLFSYIKEKRMDLEKCSIVALDYSVEHELCNRGILHDSLLSYIPIDMDLGPLLHTSESIAKNFYEHSAMDFFACNGIRLGETFESSLQAYISGLLRVFLIVEEILQAMPDISSILVPYSTMKIYDTAGPFALEDVNVIPTACKQIANLHNITFVGFGVKKLHYAPDSYLYRIKKTILELGMNVHNYLITLFVPEKPIKVFVSDYWRHLKPFVDLMDDIEFIIMDRSEALNIGMRSIWRHRMRFLHPDSVFTDDIVIRTDLKMKDIISGWEALRERKDYQDIFKYKNVSFWNIVEPLIKTLITDYSNRVVRDLFCLERLFKIKNINRVLLRATVSGQYHFLIAARVAESLNIPSIELQHASEITEPTSAFSRLGSRYLAAYGVHTRDLFVKNHGYSKGRIVPVGSPRFDDHLRVSMTTADKKKIIEQFSLDPMKPIVLVNVPDEVQCVYYTDFKSYDLIKMFNDLAEIQRRLGNVQYIFKFRPGWAKPLYRESLQEIFKERMKDIAIAEYESVSVLVVVSDIVLSGHSTMTIESMILKKPVIIYPLRKWAVAFREMFDKAALVPLSHDELRELISKLINNKEYYRQRLKIEHDFLRDNYSFDGKSSQRMVSLLRQPPIIN